MTLVSFPLFRENLGNMRELFGQILYRPSWQKIARTPMMLTDSLLSARVFLPKRYCKKLNNQKPTANTVRSTRTTLCWMRSKIKELIKLFIKVTVFLQLSFRKKSQKSIYRKHLPVFSTGGSRLDEKESHQLQYFNQSIFSCNENPCIW